MEPACFPFCIRLGSCAPRLRVYYPGFSLYELLTTLSVVSVVGTFAAGMNGVIQHHRLSAEVNQLLTDIHLTRSEAIKRGTTVTLCRSQNGITCSDDSEWREGWIIFVDPNKNSRKDDGEAVIRVQQEWPGRLALRYGGEKESYNHTTYHPAGYARPNATFTICDGRGSAKAKAIIINAAGRPRSSTKNTNSKPLDCSWASP